MPKSIVKYDKDLPEVPEHDPFLPPTSYLVKDESAEEGYRLEEGRRPSQLLLVNRLRAAVDRWRASQYEGASQVTQRLFSYWFDEEHLVGDDVFRFYFAQREALETLAYLVEIEGCKDIAQLIKTYGEIFYPQGSQRSLLDGIKIQTLTDGTRQVERYIPEQGANSVQALPDEKMQRYAFKMATGSGKTIVMAMAIVWSHFHKRLVPNSPLSSNFLIIAPNVIVYQRLEKDFASNKIFHELPLIPPEWTWNQKVILRGESTEPDPSGNLFLTNIQQIYESRDEAWTPANAIEALLGRKPVKDLASHQRSMLERIKDLKDLVVINDEAHHVHDEELEWHKTILGIDRALPKGLSLWLDFTATPKDQNGAYYPWIIVDYPLAQAVEDRIVKAPLIVHRVDKDDPDKVTQHTVIEKFGSWIVAAVARLREHENAFKSFRLKPVLFIMAEKSVYADVIGKWLIETPEFGFTEKEVLIIHTDSEGEITKADLEKAREAARDIDLPKNKIKVIVSVMMLREGWDVRNVTVVLGLRPFSAEANILPEQAVGRGLRLMLGISPDQTQTLEVIGTRKFEEFVRELEKEGVGIETVNNAPPEPITISPIEDKKTFDIVIPITEPVLSRQVTKIAELDPSKLSPVFDQEDLDEIARIQLRMDFATINVPVHHVDIVEPIPDIREILASLTNKVVDKAKLGMGFAELYPKIRDYVRGYCFGREADLDNEAVRSHLHRPMLQEAIANYLAREIGKLTIERRTLEFKRRSHRLSETKPFLWRRDLTNGPLSCKKTIFNYVATYNPYERRFAQFLEACPDILRFASLGTTNQGKTGVNFRVDYLKPSGAIGFYHPDFIAVQETDAGEVNWIIETKGREWEGTEAKDAAIDKWCKDVAAILKKPWRYIRINQPYFRDAIKNEINSFSELLRFLEEGNQITIFGKL
ncbi:MAG: DEAD/DEAH box helicase family protein [Acidobacteria bacterium]|nr:DEAD/DEAH box helicase family protein [Acidobacteriota bacterium]